MRVSDYIMNRIAEENVHHVFFVPGTGCMHLTDALAKHEALTPISVHHEQTGAMAALSYAKYNNTMGACIVTTGCGGTNAITGLLQAWQDSTPCIFISGQAQRSHTIYNSGLKLRQKGRQEANIIELVRPLTKYADMINDPADTAYILDQALHLAKSGRKGPVWIDVPLDIQNANIDPSQAKRYVPDTVSVQSLKVDVVQDIMSELVSAQRPVILAGQGIRSSDSTELFQKFVNKFQIPFVHSKMASDLVPSDNQFSVGMVGMIGASRSGNFALANSDFILVLGCRMSINLTGYEFEMFAREAKIVVLDIDPVEHQKDTVKIDQFIHADIHDFLSQALSFPDVSKQKEWQEKCNYWKKTYPVCLPECKDSDDIDIYYFVDSLSQAMPSNGIVVSDAGSVAFTVPSGIKIKQGQRSITSGAQAEMGYSVPGAIGACLASNQAPVAAVTGDGSFMMNLQELATIVHYKLPVKIFVLNNNGYSSIRSMQDEAFRGRIVGTDPQHGLGFPDFHVLANAFGIPYLRIEGCDTLPKKLKQAYKQEGPVFCEVMCVTTQVFLSVTTRMNSKRRFVKSPLEDLSPFLEREIFKSEMIIDPMPDYE